MLVTVGELHMDSLGWYGFEGGTGSLVSLAKGRELRGRHLVAGRVVCGLEGTEDAPGNDMMERFDHGRKLEGSWKEAGRNWNWFIRLGNGGMADTTAASVLKPLHDLIKLILENEWTQH